MSEKKAYVFKFNAYGSPVVAGGASHRLDINDIFTDIHSLDIVKSDTTGRILICRDEVDSDPLFIRVIDNDKTKRIVSGVFYSIKSKNLPDQFDPVTGLISPLSISRDLLDKTHFLIDTSNCMLVIHRSKSSPSTGLLAYYITEKLNKTVNALSIDVHFRKGVLEKIEKKSSKNKIKFFEMKIKKTALVRAHLLGNDARQALESLSKLSGADSIGISISLEKYHSKGGFNIDELLGNIKKFLGMEISDKPLSDVEEAKVKAGDEVINLLSSKFSISFDVPSNVMSARNVDSKAVLNLIYNEYLSRKADL
ncbi:hypothetical protein EHF33_00445 [Deinococcus psychrotolerans]|uniref:Uncharacterized protein n=1 Tax=Deinococcus psychrotolerans TaxID=2489213 RepID=A0A3G8Y7S3_9DEIO|nr:hypothetical protein [Deinococcus psychrotolerans]AZI41408.1 hypothetical protein EHF33_00445 [Deinococcus psychrotolerans]